MTSGSHRLGAEYANRVIVRQHDMLNRFVGDGADLLNHLAGETGSRLRVDDHDAVVADDYAGVRVSLCGEGPKALADFREKRFSSRSNVALRSKCLAALCL